MKNELVSATLILAIITASLYVIGLLYYDSYLGYWGIDETLFPLPVDKTLFYAFMPGVIVGLTSYIPLALVLMIAPLFVSMYLHFRKKEWWIKLFINPTEVSQEFNEDDNKIEGKSNLLFKWILIYILALSAIFLSIIGSHKFGKYSAISHHDAFKNGNGKEVFIEFKDKNQQNVTGYSIICSETHCAFYIDGSTHTILLQDIKEMTTQPDQLE